MGVGASGGSSGAAGGGLVVGLLGPVEVASAAGGLAGVGRPMLRVLVALLGVTAGRVVPDEALVDGLWGEEWSREREQNLHTHISALRRLLAAGQPGRDGARVVRSGGGYRLVAAEAEVDAGLFRSLTGQGRDAARAGDVTGAAGLFSEALGLWRGAALADVVALCPRLVGDAAGLEELRAGVVEERLECDLALGRHAEVAADGPGLVGAFPLRERLAGQVMVALYRCGRRGEALAVFDTTRRVLASELGLDPGPELAQLQARMLADDPILAGPAPVPTAVPGTPAGEALAASRAEAPGAFAAEATRALPRDTASFTGRQAELTQLVEAVAAGAGAGAGLCAIDGMAGVGKTTLAVHAAHHLAGDFPDGQFFLPLHAHTAGQRAVDPTDALASLLLIAGMAAPLIPPGREARTARWRDFIGGKKILLLLDDAAGHDQVRPLLPGTAGCLVLVTSRRRLAALEDAIVISLDTLAPGEAAGLLTRLAARPRLQPDDVAVGKITRLCGYLPLAIGLMASQLRHHPAWTAAELADGLAAAHDRLAVMHAEDLSAAAAFDLSYTDLTRGAQRLFRRLGLVPGPTIDGFAAAALDGTGLDRARRCLDELYDQHMIGEPASGRYQLHDLLREHARALSAADDSADTNAATGRLLDYYLRSAAAAGRHFASWAGYRRPPATRAPTSSPDLSTRDEAAVWLETERANLGAAADYAAKTGKSRHATQIPAAISGFLVARGYRDQSEKLQRTALAAARQAGDRFGEAIALDELCLLAWQVGDHMAAAAAGAQAVAVYQDIGDVPGQAYALTQLGMARKQAGDYPAAAACHQQSLALARRIGDRLAEADALNNLGRVQQLIGDYPAAGRAQQQALALFRELGNPLGQAVALNDLGVLQKETGDYPAATSSQQQALELFTDLGDRFGQAVALNELGDVQRLTGDYTAAASSHQQALELHRELGSWRGQAEALNSLGELCRRTSDVQQARQRHAQALAFARDVDLPLEEARALEGIGQSSIQEGAVDQGVIYLQEALVIYQRIGAPGAARLAEALHQLRVKA